MSNIDIQTLAALATIAGGLVIVILGPLQIIDTWLDIRKKMIEILEKRTS